MSLTSDDLADIKQLMEAVISVALREQDERIEARFAKQDERIEARFTKQDAHIEAYFAGQDEKLDEIMNAVGTDIAKHSAILEDHGSRLTQLESVK